MCPQKEDSYDQSRIKNIVYNDRLGYAIVYYQPTELGFVKVPRSEDICNHRRHQVINKLVDHPIKEKFHEEVEAMVRRRERETADKEIRKICEKVHELYTKVEQADMSRREILNYRVKEQIKGKSADEICDILVKDVLNHTKYIHHPKAYEDSFPHKLKLKIMTAAIRRAPSPPKVVIDNFEPEVDPNVFERVEKTLSKNLQSEIYQRKYTRTLDKIQNDIVVLKRRCTEKIDFNY
jgi:hypothetical protein